METAEADQQSIFNHLIKVGTKTIFGKDHDFAGIRSHEDFIKKVPLRDYEALRPYIEKIKQGTHNVLHPEATARPRSGHSRWPARHAPARQRGSSGPAEVLRQWSRPDIPRRLWSGCGLVPPAPARCWCARRGWWRSVSGFLPEHRGVPHLRP